jgi:hypothetical protein
VKFIENKGEHPTVELTRRNLETLLAKLSDPLSVKTLLSGNENGSRCYVKAVEDDAHYADRAPGLIWMPSEDEYH